MRSTSDHRLIVGGKDISSSNPTTRDKLLTIKAKALEKSFRKPFPSVQFRTDFKWAGDFASTKNGLPFIGSIKERPDTYFALGFAGNGITFNVAAANIICDMISGHKNADAEIFRFDR